ncbi:MAG: GMC family oxidoreductase [Thermoleophilia bacterium]
MAGAPLSTHPAGTNPLAPRRLSSSIESIRDEYDVIVVGSGYGGAIAASRLARAGRTVCLLERGRELQPGEYPDSLMEATREFQVDTDRGHLGPATGLYDFRVNRDMNVFLGCGLGGTSLVNANVALAPEPRVFEDLHWPQELRDDLASLDACYARATEMLRPAPYPANFPTLPKLDAMAKIAERLGESFYPPPINVNFEELEGGVNHVGVPQQVCRLAGDCVTGCNYAAKNTTLMNYLPDAHNHGAEIFTRTRVRHVSRRGDRWIVHFDLLDSGREAFDAPPLHVAAKLVVLGAGSLGSTEILLRSRDEGLSVSDRIGERFTGNGDVLAFAYDCDDPIRGIGWGDHAPGELPPVGPCIAGIVDVRERPELDHGMVIEEGVMPGAISALLARLFEGVAATIGRDTDPGVRDFVEERVRDVESFVAGPYVGALANTLTFLVMTHDDTGGQIVLEDGRARVVWPGVGREEIFKRVEANLTSATAALGGTYVRNPMWSQLFAQDLVTVHPLGGCPMGDGVDSGVVDHKGRVFDGAGEATVHDGLYVCDGAIIPRSLGVNPLLTISAIAERVCEHLARDRGWSIDYTLPSSPRGPVKEQRPGIQFTETMKGFVSSSAAEDYEAGARQGEREGSSFQFTVTIVADDVDALLKGADHEARIIGTVVAPKLSDHPLVVTDGLFNLFVSDAASPDDRRMRYRMRLSSEEGGRYFFDGFKRIHDDPGMDMWADTTTLYVTIHEGEDGSGAVRGQGILRIKPADFMRQMTTMRVTNAVSARQRVAALGRFSAYFTGSLHDVYGVV